MKKLRVDRLALVGAPAHVTGCQIAVVAKYSESFRKILLNEPSIEHIAALPQKSPLVIPFAVHMIYTKEFKNGFFATSAAILTERIVLYNVALPLKREPKMRSTKFVGISASPFQSPLFRGIPKTKVSVIKFFRSSIDALFASEMPCEKMRRTLNN